MAESRYVPGDHYLICDRTGWKIRASEAKQEWTGAIVRKQSWEARHPQDFVRAKKDNPAVDPKFHRPQSLDRFTGPLVCNITAVALPGADTISVDTSARFEIGDRVTVTLANKDMWSTRVLTVPDGTHLQLTRPLPDSVEVGGGVINYSAVAQPNLG